MAADLPAASARDSGPTPPTEQRHDTDTDVDAEIEAEELSEHADDAPAGPISMQRRWIRAAMPVAVLLCVVCAALAGWLGFRAWQVHQLSAAHARWVQVARQGALNLTTIDYSRVDADVQRILDSSTGRFRDDFQNRSQPFVDVVKQAQSKSEGAITEAALESTSGESAQVLVSLAVKTWAAGTQQDIKSWRMRIQVQNTNDGAKVSNVEFVP
jgi:Mce-associated membrane protein